MADTTASYVFSQNPSAVPNSRKKYRDVPLDYSKNNIMWDKRVVRGNTYAAQIPTPNQILAAQIEAQHATRPLQQAQDAANGDQMEDIDHLAPVQGRHHMEVQTDDYLEELDETVMEQEMGCQTDFVIDLPDPVIKYRKKYGEDKYTFIEKGELFDFDTAVDPILRTLMGKTLDDGREEVLQEEELRWWEEYQDKFEKERQAVIAANMEMEKEAVAAHEAKEKIMAEKRARYENEKDVAHKVACNSYAGSFLSNFQNHVLQSLEDHGVFYDPARRAVENVFLPWIREQVYWQLQERGEAVQELDWIFKRTIESVNASKDQRQLENELKRKQQEAEAKRLEEERLQKQKEEQAAAAAAKAVRADNEEDEEDEEDE